MFSDKKKFVRVSCQIKVFRMIPIDQMVDEHIFYAFSGLMSVYLPFWNMSQSRHVTSQKVDDTYLIYQGVQGDSNAPKIVAVGPSVILPQVTRKQHHF